VNIHRHKLTIHTLFFVFILSLMFALPEPSFSQGSLSIQITQSPSAVSLYDKFEVQFDVNGSVAQNLQWPYDPGPVTGMSGQSLGVGITVDGLFLPPGQSSWSNAIVIPAFLYQPTNIDRSVDTGSTNAEWIYPNGNPYWALRFAPKQQGSWQYKIRVQDDSNYPNWAESPVNSFSVTGAQPGVHGFVEVSSRDPRYFEYTDGTPFTGTGINAADNGIYHSERAAEIEFRDKYAHGKTNFHRTWMDMETIFSRGTHGWDGWQTGSDTSDILRSTDQVYQDHDFSIKLSGGNNYIVQYHNGSQRMAGAFDSGKTYKVRITAHLGGTSESNLVARLISNTDNFSSTIQTLGPNPSWQVTDLGGGWKRYESSFTNNQGRLLFKSGMSLAIGVTSGTSYLDEIYIGEDLGGGSIGPNVVFKGKLNYHQNFDAIASANWDEIYKHAENYGFALKPVINDKQDFILNNIRLSDGVFDASIGIEPTNFHSQRGYKVRRLNEYYWRYLAARWGYSRGIHSWELLNEGNPSSSAHYDHTNHLAETINTLDHNHMATTSFWNSFPAYAFWCVTDYPAVHYADVHAYISTGWLNDISLESDAAWYHIAYSEDTRYHILNAGCNKPIVRGEAGIDVLGNQNEQDELANDTSGVWLHNYLWAMLHPGGMYELYWWSDNLRTKPGPDGNTSNGLFEIFAPYNEFMGNIPLNAGGYVDIGVGSSGNNRVVGQKNNTGSNATQAHLWIQDTRHSWKNRGSGSLSGSVTIPGMLPNTSFPIEWWNFNSSVNLTKQTGGTISSDGQGNITLNLSSLGSFTDTAVKIGNYTSIPTPPPSTPTPTPGYTIAGDANNDQLVDGLDYIIWLNHFGQSTPNGAQDGDYDGNGTVGSEDYTIWIANFTG
jgi:hypothetical protein